MKTPPPIEEDEVLTQYVFNGSSPQDAPRPRDIDGLSLLRGHLNVEDAARYVRRHVKRAWEGDTVRHVRAAELFSANFTLTPTPTRKIPIHVSVDTGAEWDESVSRDFNAGFAKYADTQEGGVEDE